jgi:hypothetical protein
MKRDLNMRNAGNYLTFGCTSDGGLHRAPSSLAPKRPWFSSRVTGISCMREQRAVRVFRGLIKWWHRVFTAGQLFNSHHAFK